MYPGSCDLSSKFDFFLFSLLYFLLSDAWVLSEKVFFKYKVEEQNAVEFKFKKLSPGFTPGFNKNKKPLVSLKGL